ncbi:MAG: AbgT family transporter [bacterium]
MGEKAGNRLPHPFLLFVYITILILILAHALNGTSFTVPGQPEKLQVTTLLTADGLRYMLTNMVGNFVNFPPIGLVIPIVIAVGIGEEAGLFRAAIVKLVRSVPRSLITAVFFFAGVNGNLASDASAVIFPAVGAALFQGLGRNPLIGVVSGYAAYLGGLSANVLIVGTDATAAGITASAAQLLPVTASTPIHPAINWYFMAASAILLTVVGTYVTEKIVAPMLEEQPVILSEASQSQALELGESENRGLKYAGIALVAYVVILLALSVPNGALLRDPETNAILPRSPLIQSIVPLVVFLFMATGIAYGIGAGTIKSSYDVGRYMGKGISSIASFLVLAFFAAQFIDYFNKTNLSTFIPVQGAHALGSIGFTGIPLLIAVVFFVCLMNFAVGSAAAKWAMLAPVLVPMMGLLGYSPAFAQCAYRIGDAVTNPVSPLGSYLPILLGFLQMYKKDAGVGTAIAYELPYTISFIVMWTILLIVWYLLRLPIGPGAYIFL